MDLLSYQRYFIKSCFAQFTLERHSSPSIRNDADEYGYLSSTLSRTRCNNVITM